MEEETITNDQFWKSILIYVKNSHLVNRRLSNSIDIVLCQTNLSNIEEIIVICKSLSLDYISAASICDKLKCSSVSWERIEASLIHSNTTKTYLYLCLQKLVSRYAKNENIYRLSILDTKNLKVIFENLSSSSNPICPNFYHSIISNQGFQLTDVNGNL